MGEAASPVCFELAKRLKKAPRQIAQEIQNALPPIPGIAKVDVAGAGYLNAYFDRGAFWESAQSEAKQGSATQAAKHSADKIIVEHTSINPNKAAHIGQVVADAIVTCHLRTMARLGISYELLARESEILHLHFWDLAFAKLKEAGAIQYVQHGKMAGCWVMPWREEGKDKTSGIKTDDTETQSTESVEGTEEDENTQDKIIVRSNGTVTYVGKNIAYQLWKFGLLGKDFHYAKLPTAPERDEGRA